jgi:SAM-dependent methyltransferase
LQIADDLVGVPFERLRVLDLACLEGLYGAEFAAHGATVVGVEIRAANIEKACFVKRVLGLDSYELIQDDVRSATPARFGEFDVAICSGILYHLEAADAAALLRNLRAMTRRLLMVDTRIARKPEVRVTLDSKEYWGCVYREHKAGTTAQQREHALWSPADNETSFWFTRESLVNLLRDTRYTSVFECHAPGYKKLADDRLTMVAVPGRQIAPLLAPTEGLVDHGLSERG